MNKDMAIFLSVIGLFALAGFIFHPEVSVWLPAMLLVLCGCAAFVFSSALANAERHLAKSISWLNVEPEARPLKYKLWGVGVVLVGLVWLAQGAA